MRKKSLIVLLVFAILITGCIPVSTDTKQNQKEKLTPTLENVPSSSESEEETQPTITKTVAESILEATETDEPTPTEALLAPTETQEPEPEPSGNIDENASYIQAAMRDLMFHLSIGESDIKVLSVEAVDWGDASLDCPLIGANYAQVATPGYKVMFSAKGGTYTYHTDAGVLVVLCGGDGSPVLPEITIPKDEEIKDGIPWVPVD